MISVDVTGCFLHQTWVDVAPNDWGVLSSTKTWESTRALLYAFSQERLGAGVLPKTGRAGES